MPSKLTTTSPRPGRRTSRTAFTDLPPQPGAEHFAAAWEAAIDRGIARLEDCALERAIAGEERLVMRGGEVVARWTRYDTGLLQFLLRQRRPGRWNSEGAHFANLRPGHPVFDRLKREWERQLAIEAAANHEEVIQSLNAKLELMRQRQLAAIARAAGGEDDGDSDEDDDGA